MANEYPKLPTSRTCMLFFVLKERRKYKTEHACDFCQIFRKKNGPTCKQGGFEIRPPEKLKNVTSSKSKLESKMLAMKKKKPDKMEKKYDIDWNQFETVPSNSICSVGATCIRHGEAHYHCKVLSL
ncbi:hypothetical protein RFI_04190 [Reticulomyxa filosa]|uniref:Uncharacterized protein n=1 Tax=Reticulomyxa filosa TaxID=46433 RepID=X6P5P9_RETFI|nr:hypothetical protein RFI_04190 [Reticulomyxa filosa]|eukprot:ETO32927.1 hypothetical protein RFI_04190 [Reticulomyxa filosa]